MVFQIDIAEQYIRLGRAERTSAAMEGADMRILIIIIDQPASAAGAKLSFARLSGLFRAGCVARYTERMQGSVWRMIRQTHDIGIIGIEHQRAAE